MYKTHRPSLLLTIAASALLTACGAPSETATEGSVQPASVDGAVEKPVLKLGFIKLTDMAPLAIAKEKGFFQEEGLHVMLRTASHIGKTLTSEV